MKKSFHYKILFVLPVCILSTQGAFGQTLTCQTHCPTPGEIFAMKTSSPVPNSSGTNQLWNFGAVAAISPGTHMVSYSAAASVPSASLYPQATIYKSKSGSGGFLSVGNGGIRSASAITASVNMDVMQLPLPFAYGDSYSETVIFTNVSGTDTIKTYWVDSFHAHGSGTLILPSGTHPNVLAIQVQRTESTKKNGILFGYIDHTNTYYYYSQYVSHYLLFTSQRTTTGPEDYVPYTEFMDHVVQGLQSENADDQSEMSVFPNPTGDLVNIVFAAVTKGTLVLKNTLGQQLIEKKYEGGPCNLNVGDLPEGMYVVSFVSGTFSFNKRLVVNR